ncbi:MAG: gamma-glutamyl-gamma-aminobutyrate hydrolase family protein [Planctomycetes bacterium]|nr:gamma-glutamyl-gamma-aminobutyrate hydrolase family protein [Planctomycetota bacterium]
MSLPVVGVVSYGPNEKFPGRFHLPVGYVHAIRRARGRAAIFAPGDGPPEEILDSVRALLLAGGGDLDPATYGERRHEAIYGVDAARDDLEISLARLALARGVPTLAICRGCQVVNVALGGDLVQHLADVVPGGDAHRGPAPGERARHAVRIAPGSRLAAVCGAEAIEVASSHHQAAKRLGRGLVASAWAEDGTIEALESPERPELLAVQWHPEETAGEDPRHQSLFDWLVEHARGTGSKR